MYEAAVTCLVVTAILAYVNKRFVGLPTVIGVMAIALVLSFALIGLDRLGIRHLRDYEATLIASVDFSDRADAGHAVAAAVRRRPAHRCRRTQGVLVAGRRACASRHGRVRAADRLRIVVFPAAAWSRTCRGCTA